MHEPPAAAGQAADTGSRAAGALSPALLPAVALEPCDPHTKQESWVTACELGHPGWPWSSLRQLRQSPELRLPPIGGGVTQPSPAPRCHPSGSIFQPR